MVINPIAGVYIPIIRIPIEGGMTIPNIVTFDHGTYEQNHLGSYISVILDSSTYPPWVPNIFAPENGWLEYYYYSFPLGWPISGGELLVLGSVSSFPKRCGAKSKCWTCFTCFSSSLRLWNSGKNIKKLRLFGLNFHALKLTHWPEVRFVSLTFHTLHVPNKV